MKDKEETFENNYVTKSVERVLHESMLPYSEFVIMDRALPRVEDGLKPVQRRVLYSMLEVGVLPDRPYRKSARIVGDCMGKYHPHGDRSIYDTMVRMAQGFNMEEVLVDGHGNFGSIDGDSAAAMRYTEAKLSPISLELLKDIEKDTVKWSFNFDDSRKEPDILPGRFPNLLVNGGTGIAVGLATNIPTHNLGETIDATVAYIENKDITLHEMMKYLPAPDFPTGGYLLNTSEFEKAYETGKGRLIIQAKLHIENADNGKKNIVITDIPYNVNKSVMLQKIAKEKEKDSTGLLSSIYEIVDESDRSGIRAVIKLKRDSNVQAILALLYKTTDLRTSFGVNMVAIASGKPRLMGLLDIISYYVDYQQQVIYRRTKFDLESCLKKEHILEGLYVAICNIDEVIRIIKTSKSTSEAKSRLIERFTLTDVQAQAILDMRLARLTSLEVEKLVSELKRLKQLIREYTQVLKSPKMQMDIVKKELLEIKEKYATPRRTKIIEEDIDISETSSIALEMAEDVYVVVTPNQTIKNVSQKGYNMSNKDLNDGANLFEVPEFMCVANTQETLLLFTDCGNFYKLGVKEIPQCRFRDKGYQLATLIKNLTAEEKIVAVFKEKDFVAAAKILMVTKSGMIKISAGEEYSIQRSSAVAIKLREDDHLMYVAPYTNERLAMISESGMGVSVPLDDISLSGRVSIGVKGMQLADMDLIAGVSLVGENVTIAIISDSGFAKNMPVSELPKLPRNRKGVKIMIGKSIFKILYIGLYDCVCVSGDDLIYVKRASLQTGNKNSSGKSITGNKAGKKISNAFTYDIYE